MRNLHLGRNIFGDLPTQQMAQKGLPILVSKAQKGKTILLRELAEEFGIFKQGIDYLGPGNKVQIFLFWTTEIPDLSTQSLTITVSHNDCKPEKDIKFLLDFTMWEGVGQQFKELEPIAEIEQTLKEDIAKSLSDIAQKL